MRHRSAAFVLLALAACTPVDRRDTDGMTALMRAAQNGDSVAAAALIAAGADVNAELPAHDAGQIVTLVTRPEAFRRTEVGFTPLLYAARHRHARVARLLVAQGANASHVARDGQTPLGFAVFNGDVELTRTLVGAGARADHALMARAVAEAPPAIVAALLQGGADPNGPPLVPPAQRRRADALPPLIVAATMRGEPAIVKSLIDARANVNARDRHGWTALRWARDGARRDKSSAYPLIAEMLRAAGANDTAGLKAQSLHEAVAANDLRGVSRALAGGANPNATDNHGVPPLVLASIAGRTRIAAALIGAGAQVNVVPHFSPTPLVAAVEGEHVELAKLLIANRANSNLADGRGWSPLIVASMRKRPELMRLLLADSARVDRSALQHAVGQGDTSIVSMLLARWGARPLPTGILHSATYGCRNQDNTAVMRVLLQRGADAKVRIWNTALHSAAGRCSAKAIQLLVDAGADVNARESDGGTALMIAARAGRLENVRVLLAAGARRDLEDDNGLTVLSHAARYPEIVRELREFVPVARRASR